MFYRREFPNTRIGIHNFASVTNPGGGVRKGSRVQEEALCRCMTLLPVLDAEENRERFYQFHWNRRDSISMAACLYTPDILAIKTDVEIPSRLKRDKWQPFDMVTMAAPNLRLRPNHSMNPGHSRAANLTERELSMSMLYGQGRKSTAPVGVKSHPADISDSINRAMTVGFSSESLPIFLRMQGCKQFDQCSTLLFSGQDGGNARVHRRSSVEADVHHWNQILLEKSLCMA